MKRVILTLILTAAALVQPGVATSTTGKALGNPSAPIRIEVFSDYQCSACKQFHEETLLPLIKNYVNTGKVYLVNREYPLTAMHPHALAAARVACAAEQMGKYRDVCNQLFRTQDAWSKNGDVIGAASSVLTPADATKLRELAAAPETAKSVEEDVRAGQAEKVGGTPTIIITKMIRRYPVNGAVSYTVLSRFLDSILN
jgi:protein-disulfide isomerase